MATEATAGKWDVALQGSLPCNQERSRAPGQGSREKDMLPSRVWWGTGRAPTTRAGPQAVRAAASTFWPPQVLAVVCGSPNSPQI